jgi:formylglycine-generating enzyme required for sulfatase activity
VSEWFNACTSCGTRTFPYGNTVDYDACNTALHDVDTCTDIPAECMEATGSMATCQSNVPGYQGIYDLSGNAAEWENACTPDNADPSKHHCRIRGGSGNPLAYQNSACTADGSNARDLRAHAVGIRCCAPLATLP